MIVEQLPRTHLGQRWRGVLLLLTGDDMGGDEPDDPLRESILGQHEFLADGHYGVVSPERVAVVKQALESVDVDAAIDDGSSAKGLRGLLGRGRTRIHGIVCDHPAEAVRSAHEALLSIYRDAARQGAGVVIAIG